MAMDDRGALAGTVRAALWASGSAWFNGAFAAVCWLVTARFVSASELGAYAVAGSWAGLVALGLTSLALPLPVLHHGGEPGVVRTALCTALGLSGLVIVTGAALTRIGIPPAALVPMFLVMLTQRVIGATAQCLEAELERRLEFRSVAMNRTTISMVVCTLQTVLAWQGMGAWAIVIREILGSSMFLVFTLWRVRDALGGSVTLVLVKRVLGTGLTFLPEQIFDRLAGIADGLVVAPLAGLSTVGALVQLRTLAGYVRMALVPFLIPVSRAAFATMREDPAGRARVRSAIGRFLWHVALPVSALFVAAPHALEGLLWGPDWAVATVALPALAFQVVLGPLMELRLMEAVGCDRPGLVALARAGSLVVYLAALVLLVPLLGARGAALALGLATVPGILAGARMGSLELAPRDAIPLMSALLGVGAAAASGLPPASLARIPLVIGVYVGLLALIEGRWLFEQFGELKRMASGAAPGAEPGPPQPPEA